MLAATFRVHLDNVEDLGRFLEFEVPVQAASEIDQDSSKAEEIAAATLSDLIAGLGYTQDEAIFRSYLELLQESQT